MSKIKKILLAIGAGIAAIFEAFMLLFFFDRKKDKWENEKKDLENTITNQDAAIIANKTYQEEHKKNEETKQQINTNYGSDTSVNAALDLMRNNQNRSKARKSTGV